MLPRAQRQILLHALIVLLVGLLCGAPYGRAITQGWGEEAVRGWRLAHFSLVVGGIWLMVVAATLQLLVLGARGIAILKYSVMTSGYGFTVALVIGAAGGVRGLEATGSMLNVIAFCGNISASVASLVWAAVSIVGVVKALGQTNAG